MRYHGESRMVRRAATRQLTLALALLAGSARAQAPRPAAEPAPDRYELALRAEIYASLFRRAPLPGPYGAVVVTETALPVQQAVRLRASRVDLPFARDSLEIEVAGWTREQLVHLDGQRAVDGDVQTASVRYEQRPFGLRLGRQHAAGGAARFVRFDGAALSLELPASIAVEAYGGFTVLPRWDRRPGYYQLGAATEGLLRDPDALPDPERSGHWLAGARVGFGDEDYAASASLHEQRDDGALGRRNLGLDGRAVPFDGGLALGSAVFDVDGERFSDLSLLLSASPHDDLELAFDFLHAEPALYLSRQSVLSVFSTDTYEEAGASADLELGRRASLHGGGWLQFYEQGHAGARGDVTVRLVPGPGRRTLVRLGYARLLAPDNGYHSVRASVSRRLLASLTGTLEAYQYLYDAAIRGRISSAFYAASLGYEPLPALDVLLAASLATSPYARADASTMVRVGYAFDHVSSGGAP